MPRYKETTGYIIHTRNFKDTSLILEFFSKDQGMIHLVAKGIKKNKNLKSQVSYFNLLKVQYFGKSQLKTISAINIISHLDYCNLIEKTAALYLNELVHYSLVENEKASSLFSCYQNSLKNLGHSKLTPILREFEKHILSNNGFKLSVDQFNNPDDWLFVSETEGLTLAKNEKQKLCQVIDLENFLMNTKLMPAAQKNINKLMLGMIDLSLSYRKLYSRDMLRALFQ